MEERKRPDFHKLNVLKVVFEVKGDTKKSELLTQPLGELRSIIYNRDRLKIV